MNVTKVNIRPVDMMKVKAIASITIDNEFVVHDLRVVEGDKGYFVAMPSRKLPNGEFRDVAHPINTTTRYAIQDAVLAEFASAMSLPAEQVVADRGKATAGGGGEAKKASRPAPRDVAPAPKPAEGAPLTPEGEADFPFAAAPNLRTGGAATETPNSTTA